MRRRAVLAGLLATGIARHGRAQAPGLEQGPDHGPDQGQTQDQTQDQAQDQAQDQDQKIGGPFRLIGGDGQTVTDRRFRGKFLILFFGYTNCPDACPTALYRLAQALRRMGPAVGVQGLFVTIDPRRDSPALAAHYAALFSPRIMGLSGTPAEIAAIVREYHVYVGPEDPKTGAIAHGTLFYVVGPDGNFLTALPDDLSAAALAARLNGLMN